MSEKFEKEHVDVVEPAEVDTVGAQGAAPISLWQAIKQNPKIVLFALLMNSGPMAFGFDIVIVGVVTAVPSFLTTFGEPLGNQYILPSTWLALWNAFVQVGFIVGAMANAPLADRFGRRISMGVGAIIATIAIAIIYVADQSGSIDGRRGLFLAGKTILGVGMSMMMATCQTYTSEVVPTRLRALVLSSYQFSLLVGQVAAAAVAGSQIAIGFTPKAFQVCFATQWAFSGLALIAACVIPESPAYLLRRGKTEAAAKSFARLHKPEYVEESIQAMNVLLQQEKEMSELTKNVTYRQCFQGTNWRRTRIIIYASIANQFLGITFVANGSYFMIVAGMSPENSITVIEVALCLALVGNIASFVLASTLGRRRTFLACCAWLVLVWISVGIAGCFQNQAALWYMGIMINLVLFFYGLSAGGVIPIVTAETSSVQLRAKSSSIGFASSGVMSLAFNFFVPFLFNADQANLGGKTGFIFAGLSVVAGVVLFFELPELKNRTYLEVDEMFAKKLKTREFAKYQSISDRTGA